MSDVLLPYPPAANLWDHAAIVAGALAVLRLEANDPDAPRVDDAAKAAESLVDAWVDHVDPTPITEPMRAGAIQVAVELYRRKDAPFGVVDAWSQDTLAFRISGDPLAGVLALLLPEKTRWGIA